MTTEERFEMLEAELAGAKRLTRRLMAGAGVVVVVCTLFVAVRAMTGVMHGQAGKKTIRVNELPRSRVAG